MHQPGARQLGAHKNSFKGFGSHPETSTGARSCQPSARNAKRIERQLALGIQHGNSGALSEAEACFQQVLQWQPDNAEAWYFLGVVAVRQQQYPSAIARIERAIAIDSTVPKFHTTLSEVYLQQRQWVAATECCERLLQLQPNNANALANLGTALREQQQIDRAIATYRQALELQPGNAAAHANLGIALIAKGEVDAAIASFRRALELQPNNVTAHNNLGAALVDRQQSAAGLQSLRRALEIQPDYAGAYTNLGAALAERGEVEAAIAAFRQALELQPDNANARTQFVAALNYIDALAPAEIYREHRRWSECHVAPLLEAVRAYGNDRNPDRRLRLGYVSADFRMHSVAFFLEPLLAAHDRERFEVFCYASNRQHQQDAVTERFRQLADGWRDIAGLTDAQAANAIERDAIDILIDLAGHTVGNRIRIFAYKPAPIQVSYLGYPNTTGLDTIDYRLTDRWADPEGQTDGWHVETLVRLPHGFLCYQPWSPRPEVGPLPSARDGRITFGSFNNITKISPQVIACWAALLNAVPGSRLLLKAMSLSDPAICDRLRVRFQAQGIAPERVELCGWLASKAEHFALYNRVDIALDTFPYHGTTTTCEALWMGVPVITLAGPAHVSRVGVSLLASLGLESLIANSPEDYCQKAIDLARDRARLQQFRETLRPQMQAAPLTDAKAIARSIEAAYRWMWRHYCLQLPAEADRQLVAMADGVKICVRDDLSDLTTYTLLERGDWFEPEIAFVRQFMAPGMQAMDVGARHGIYALAMAKALAGSGRVMAYEPDPETCEFLQEGVRANAFSVVEAIAAGLGDRAESEGPMGRLTLDGELERRGWPEIDFLRLDASSEAMAVLAGGQKFFSEYSPLVMGGRAREGEFHPSLLQRLQELGYDPYIFVPGIGLLAPWEKRQPVERFQLNLFACKPERARQLAARGLLVREIPATPALPNASYWFGAISALAYAKSFCARWQQFVDNPNPANQGYLEGLSYYCLAKAAGTLPGDRLVALQHALTCLQQAVEARASLARRCSLVRVALELGQRAIGVRVLQEIVAVLGSDEPPAIDEPFLPASQQYDDVGIEKRLADYLFSSLIETYESNRDFSAYFSPQETIALLASVIRKPCHRPRSRYRLQLARAIAQANSGNPDPS